MSFKSLILKTVRNGLGLIIVFFDWLTRPKGAQHSEQEQQNIQETMQGLSLYHFYACPFCVRTRRALHKLNIQIENRDINKNPEFRKELQEGGGKVQVPCLRIEENNNTRWLYESKDIVSFLEKRIGVAS